MFDRNAECIDRKCIYIRDSLTGIGIQSFFYQEAKKYGFMFSAGACNNSEGRSLAV